MQLLRADASIGGNHPAAGIALEIEIDIEQIELEMVRPFRE